MTQSGAIELERWAMDWPVSSDELRKAGYLFDNDGTCRGCREPIEWWVSPSGKKMPMTVRKKDADLLHASAEVREPHFIRCPNAKDFRK